MSTASTSIQQQFKEQGYAILPGAIPLDTIDRVRAALETEVDAFARRLRDDGTIENIHADKPFETRIYDLFENCLDKAPHTFLLDTPNLPELLEIYTNTDLLDVIETIIGPEIRLYPNYYIRPKMPRLARLDVSWHQDAQYTEDVNTEGDVESLTTVNCWAGLVPVTAETGSMQFVPGSHTVGLLPHGHGPHWLETPEEVLNPIIAERGVVDVEVDPGDVVVFSNLLLHSGQPNVSDIVRWSLDFRYQVATEPTLRPETGHLVRSRQDPGACITPERWLEVGDRSSM